MNIFNDLNEKLISDYSAWIKIVVDQSKWVIDNFPYETGVDENITKPHCWRCVTVNQCCFKMRKARNL